MLCVCICASMSTFLKGPFGYSYLDMLKNSTLTLYADSILLLKSTGVALNLNPKALNTIRRPNVNPWLGPLGSPSAHAGFIFDLVNCLRDPLTVTSQVRSCDSLGSFPCLHPKP